MPILPGDIITADLLVRDVYTLATGGSSSISTTENAEVPFSIDIPSDWTQYDVYFDAACRLLETGAAAGVTTITARIREGSTTAGTEIENQSETIGDAAPDNSKQLVFNGVSSGRTDTGTVNFAWTAQAGSNSGLISWSRLRIAVHARRTD